MLVAGEVEVGSMLEHGYFLEYHNISYLINASIYLVKGGRLGLMPGVLFHSCRPSFRHTCRGIVTADVLVQGLSRGAIATRKLEVVNGTRNTRVYTGSAPYGEGKSLRPVCDGID